MFYQMLGSIVFFIVLLAPADHWLSAAGSKGSVKKKWVSIEEPCSVSRQTPWGRR